MRPPIRRLRAALTGEGRPGERRLARTWAGPGEPGRILLIRLQAIGDAIAILPIAAGLRDRFPGARLGCVVGERAAAVATTCRWFDEVHVLESSRGPAAMILAAARLGLKLRNGWEVVLDLQRNDASRVLRRLVAPSAFGEMDRFGARHGLVRSLAAVDDAGISTQPRLVPHVHPDLVARARARLEAEAAGAALFVLLNPGGWFPTRRWPTDRWVELARRLPEGTAVVVSGLERVADLARRLRGTPGFRVVDLVGRSDLADGLATVAACDLAVSEDGAFLHAAWCGAVPTVALLGGTRSDWVRPLGPRTRFRGSEDLSCGGCMLATCPRGDVHCLDRISVDEVLGMAVAALGSPTGTSP